MILSRSGSVNYGRATWRTDKREPTDEHFGAATTMYREMGMTHWVEKAEAEMLALGG